MIKRLLLLSSVCIICINALHAQFFLGMQSSAYGGVTTVDFNPAIADSRYIADINIIGLGLGVNNNYVGISRKDFFNHNLFNDPNFQADQLQERINGKDKNVYIGAQIQGPLSFMFSFGKKDNKNKNAIAVTYHVNSILNVDKVDETFARIAYYGVGTKADSLTHFLGQSLTNGNINLRELSWADYGITYSRVIIDNDKHMLKVGGTLKLLQGIEGGYVYVKDLQYKWSNYDTISVFKTGVKYAYSQGMVTSNGFPANNISSYAQNLTSFKYSYPSAAVDLGVIYEWRPDKDKYKYQMDCQDNWRLDLNRYKLSAGVSLIDFGAIRFKQGQYSGDFNANISNWDVQNAKFPNGLQSLDDTIHSRFSVTPNQKNYFTMWLPTRINAFLDYNIYKGVGANFVANISPNMAPNRNMVHHVTTFSITPKYENAWFGIYLPVSYDVMGNFDWGATIRVGPLTIGTQDILGLFAKKFVYNADIHAALKITIPYTKKHDKDKDGVSNKYDKCPKDQGPCISHGCPDRDSDGVLDKDDRCPDVPGPARLQGCPDMDSDGVVDIDDSCPTVPGPAALHGCPDRDSDGIPDYLDECPDVAGLAKFNGCPDRDSDGIPDKLDLCPDKPGSIEHHGCPDTDGDGVYDDEDRCVLTPGPKENQGCPWPDRDGDGIPDKDDKCPDVFGLPENHGCPALAKKEIETIKYAFENLEFETGKDIIRTHSYPSLNALANLLIEKTNYGLHIAGHTDNVGKPEMNMILSEKRANAVKAYLMKKGVDGSKLETVGYGDTKPVADNSTPEGRQKNRRVEMEITFR
jgi:outer membrane protein OmpA-like peptidoglycan-associated protein